MAKRVVAAKDHQKLVERYKAGVTLEQIGSEFGVTRERVRQILKKSGIGRLDGGSTVRAFKQVPDKIEALRTKAEKREADCRARWGMSLDDYTAHVAEYGSCATTSSPMRKYVQHRKNALFRGLEWNFTFAEWWKVWQDSGKWEQRGRWTGYVMARYGDGDTPYSPATVYICTQSQNVKDGYIVRPDRQAGIRPAAEAQVARAKLMRAQRGNSRGSARLTEDQVRAIRIDTRPSWAIAGSYGVSGATISLIKSRKTWQHVA